MLHSCLHSDSVSFRMVHGSVVPSLVQLHPYICTYGVYAHGKLLTHLISISHTTGDVSNSTSVKKKVRYRKMCFVPFALYCGSLQSIHIPQYPTSILLASKDQTRAVSEVMMSCRYSGGCTIS